MATIVYGSEIAKGIKQDLKEKIDRLKDQGKRIPKLVVVLIGNHPASLSYVKGKENACQAIGMANTLLRLPEHTREEEVLKTIHELNEDANVDGILVQLPLPAHMNESNILLHIHPSKDVDGFHPLNLGKLLLNKETFISCTPKGILRILENIGLKDLSGKRVVVIGRSNIVGKPLAQLLLNKNATMTICHSKTEEIQSITSQADILIAAVGKEKIVTRDWIKEGAIVIDVGINRDANNKLCGDVDFDDVLDKVSYITPVPKGVGPMTIAMLLENTFAAYEHQET